MPLWKVYYPEGAYTVERDEDGFILTGSAVGRDDLLETSVPGVYAAGDVRAGSTKRCAAAVGEGAMVVQLVHGHIREQRTITPAAPK